ncbi:MAG: response regulator [Caldilineaceae bacterium]
MSLEKIQILLIEDDKVDRELVRRFLEPIYNLREAATGREGLAAVALLRPQLVLLDYRLPDMNSVDLLQKLVAADLPVIMLTGEEEPNVIVQAMQRGAQDYLIKGQLSTSTLEHAVTNALEKVALRRNVAEQQHQLAAQAETLAEQNRQIRVLASALTLAEQRERRRVAQLLHDQVQQLLYGLQMRFHLITEDMPSSAPPDLQRTMAEATSLLTDVIVAVRSLSVDLSPPILQDEGIDVALQWLATHTARVHGLQVDLQIEEGYKYQIKSEELHVLIFHLVRELLSNVVKHANVREARVHLFIEDGQPKITIEDEGVGFEAAQIVQPVWDPNQGYGLYSVRERLALFGGQLKVDSHPGNGTYIEIILPKNLWS